MEPPSITMFCPVMYAGAVGQQEGHQLGDLRRLDPTRASGVPRLDLGPQPSSAASTSFSGVRTNPGETQLTRIVGASSSAAAWVSATTAALAAEYGASPRVGRTPDTLATLTIAPAPPRAAVGHEPRGDTQTR